MRITTLCVYLTYVTAINITTCVKQVILMLSNFLDPLSHMSQFLALRFCAPYSHKPKNWLSSACFEKNFLSLRSVTIIIQLLLFFTHH